MLGLPPSLLQHVKADHTKATQLKNAMLGNRFHVPSFVIVLFLLLSTLQVQPAHSIPTPLGLPPRQQLQARICDSLLDQHVWSSFPPSKSAADVVRDMQLDFRAFQVAQHVYIELQEKLTQRDLRTVQVYHVYAHMHTFWDSELPP